MNINLQIKLKNIFKQIFFISFFLFLFSVFLIGLPILTNNYTIEKIDIDYVEIQVVGKQTDPMLRIIDGQKVTSGDCYVSLGKLCSKYQYQSLFGKENKIIILDGKYSIILYSDMVDENRSKLLVNNFDKEDKIIDEFINRKKFLPNILLFFLIFSLLGFFIVNFFYRKNTNK